MYQCQFSGITSHFATLSEASAFCELYRQQTGAILGITEEARTRTPKQAVSLPERADLDRQYADRTIKTKGRLLCRVQAHLPEG